MPAVFTPSPARRSTPPRGPGRYGILTIRRRGRFAVFLRFEPPLYGDGAAPPGAATGRAKIRSRPSETVDAAGLAALRRGPTPRAEPQRHAERHGRHSHRGTAGTAVDPARGTDTYTLS